MRVPRRSVRGACVLVAAAGWAGVLTASARAAVYCVNVASTTGCDHVESPGTAGLGAAFAAADGDVAADTIEIGAGTYPGPLAATAGGGPLTVIGAGSTGATATTLTVTADGETALALAAAGSSVSHLHVALPDQAGDTALDLNGAASDVVIDDPSGSTQAIGVEMNHPDTFSGMVELGNGAASTGIDRTANGSGSEIVSDSTIFATEGISATSGSWTIEHDKVIALNYGVQAASGNNGAGVPAVVAIDDSLIRVTTTDPSTCGAIVPCFALGVSGGSTISGDRLTVAGAGQQIAGGWALGAISGETATLNLNSTVVTGFTPALKCAQSNGGTAELSATYSDFGAPVATAGGCAAPPAGHNTSAPADLVNGAFELKWDSPLIDAGDPHTVHDPTDLDGNPRVVDGNHDSSAIVDIGAFEYQRRSPSVTAQTVAQGPVGAAIPFAVKQASDPDPGDALTFTWSFDDGGTATGAQATHAFATAGPHAGTVTATDPTGLAATSTVKVQVVTRPPTTGTTRPPRPKITSLKQSHARWKPGSRMASIARHRHRSPVGTVFSFRLNTAASLKLTFRRSVGGRRARHRCVAPSRRNRHKPACRRSVRAGKLTVAHGRAGANRIAFQGRLSRHRRLAAGTYTLTLNAKNASGETTAHAITFTIVTR